MRHFALGVSGAALLIGAAVYGVAIAADDPAAPPEKGAAPAQREFRVFPPGAADSLKLTTGQEKDIAELEKDVQAKMAKILTTEQLDQWNKSRPEGGRGRRPGPAGRRGQPGAGSSAEGPPREGLGGGLERTVRGLKLTDEQKEKVQEVLKTNRERMRHVMEEQRAELVKALKGVLSDEQQQELDKALPSAAPDGPPRGPRDNDAPPKGPEPPPKN